MFSLGFRSVEAFLCLEDSPTVAFGYLGSFQSGAGSVFRQLWTEVEASEKDAVAVRR